MPVDFLEESPLISGRLLEPTHAHLNLLEWLQGITKTAQVAEHIADVREVPCHLDVPAPVRLGGVRPG